VGKVTFKRRNLNRFRKVYPYLRRAPVYSYCADSEVVIEVGEAEFDNASSTTYSFQQTYSTVPSVTAISVDSENNNTANVNVFIQAITLTNVTFGTSQAFTGKVNFQIILLGC
jgi:hypothetical protein